MSKIKKLRYAGVDFWNANIHPITGFDGSEKAKPFDSHIIPIATITPLLVSQYRVFRSAQCGSLPKRWTEDKPERPSKVNRGRQGWILDTIKLRTKGISQLSLWKQTT